MIAQLLKQGTQVLSGHWFKFHSKLNFFFHVFFATAQVVRYNCLKVHDCYLNPFVAAHFNTPVQAKIDDF